MKKLNRAEKLKLRNLLEKETRRLDELILKVDIYNMVESYKEERESIVILHEKLR